MNKHLSVGVALLVIAGVAYGFVHFMEAPGTATKLILGAVTLVSVLLCLYKARL